MYCDLDRLKLNNTISITGAATVIMAMGAGRIAARAMQEYLGGERLPTPGG